MKWFGQEDVNQLIARGKLKRAIQILEVQLHDDPESISCRQQLGDILGRAGKKQHAIRVLAPLIDQFTQGGFAAKAIAVIKKIERMDPDRVDTAQLIAKVRRSSESAQSSVPLIPAHLESDTISGIDIPVRNDKERPMATSEIDPNWYHANKVDHRWSPLLDDLAAEDFDAIIGRLSLIVKNSGAIITGQGERAASIFVLASGYARGYRRSDNNRYRQALIFEEGQFFGEEALMESKASRPITVTAASECELLEIDLDNLERIVAANPLARSHLERVYRARAWVF